MELVDDFVDWVKRISNTGWYQVIEFFFFLSSIVGFLQMIFKKSSVRLGKNFIVILLFFLIGAILPTIRLLIGDWSGTVDFILNALAILCLISFLGFLLVFQQMGEFISKIQKEEQTIHIRGTHGFFNGTLQVHLEWEEFGGYPPYHKMTGKIWTPGKKEIHFKNKGIGFSISYDSKYLIRITGAQINKATFEVTKK